VNAAVIQDVDCAVIGAGISGLSAGYWLARRGISVEVIEAAARPGGVIGTECAGGLLYERGPNSILDTNPHIARLLENVGVLDRRIEASAVSAKRFVVRSGKLVALPTSLAAFLTTRLFSSRAKLALLREPFVAPAPTELDEAVADFVVRRLGHEFLNYAIEPFVAGIYAGNAEQLSLRAAFPKLHALEQRYGSLIKGQIYGARERARRIEKPRSVAASFSFRDGMQTLTDALAGALPRLRGAGRAAALLVAVATLTLVGNFVLYLVALDHATPSVTQVVIQLAPLLLLVGGVVVFHEKLAGIQWAGFAILVTGLLLFFNDRLPELLRPSEGIGLGVALTVAAAISWAIYGLAQKLLLRHFTARFAPI